VNFTMRIQAVQFEEGSVRSAYQSNVSQFDVTEPGQRNVHYLAGDAIDDWMSLATAFAPAGAYTIAAGRQMDAGLGHTFGRSADGNAFARFGIADAELQSAASNRRLYTNANAGRASHIFTVPGVSGETYHRNGALVAVSTSEGAVHPLANSITALGRSGSVYAGGRIYCGLLLPRAVTETERALIDRVFGWHIGVSL
jgi:hypothetical protein